jgi:hypothetical protein
MMVRYICRSSIILAASWASSCRRCRRSRTSAWGSLGGATSTGGEGDNAVGLGFLDVVDAWSARGLGWCRLCAKDSVESASREVGEGDCRESIENGSALESPRAL